MHLLDLVHKRLLAAKIKFRCLRFTSKKKYVLLHRNAYDILSEKEVTLLYKTLANRHIKKFEKIFNENIYYLLKTKKKIWAIPAIYSQKNDREPIEFLDKKIRNMFKPVKTFRSIEPNDYVGFRGFIIDYKKLF